jgi:hypothetical protein
VPLAVAILLTFILAPPVRLLRRWRLGRLPSIIIVVLIAFLAIFGLGTVLGEQVSHLAAALPKGVQIKKLHAASSSDEFQLGSEGVALVCVSYLDVGDASARIWAAIRRVRRQLPRATVLAGLWGPNNDQSGEMRAEVNADPYARCFCEAAKQCVEAAAAGRRLPQASVPLQTLSAGSLASL